MTGPRTGAAPSKGQNEEVPPWRVFHSSTASFKSMRKVGDRLREIILGARERRGRGGESVCPWRPEVKCLSWLPPQGHPWAVALQVGK